MPRDVTARLIVAFRNGDLDEAVALHDQLVDMSMIRRDSEGVPIVEYTLNAPAETVAPLAILLTHRG